MFMLGRALTSVLWGIVADRLILLKAQRNIKQWGISLVTGQQGGIGLVIGPSLGGILAQVLSIPLIASFPFLTALSGFELTLTVNCASVLKNILSVAIITGLFILQNNAVLQHQRGAANGLSMSAQSCSKQLVQQLQVPYFHGLKSGIHLSFQETTWSSLS
ncbi:hypothetical protein HPP92_006204 [Vanilla planifolia]|uniref:Uncharacterized protein n=1 Tax=Vanilla planifolia TaxID=51239 RepID=A0A835RVF0_VANPL|nr:hypothetical protein HPP92_006204 [Vanilla planifolia]